MFDSVATVAPTMPKPAIPLPDRTANNEAMLLGFLAEKSLPFTIAEDLLDLAKALSTDKKALNSMSMHRTSASYKIRYGLAKTFADSLIEE